MFVGNEINELLRCDYYRKMGFLSIIHFMMLRQISMLSRKIFVPTNGYVVRLRGATHCFSSR